MTIFDVLRYPISIPPLQEELDALPASVRWTWYERKNWHHLNSPARMLQTQWTNFGSQPYILEDLAALKTLLIEYEE